MAVQPHIGDYVRHPGPGQPIELVRVRDGCAEPHVYTVEEAERIGLDLLQAVRSNRANPVRA